MTCLNMNGKGSRKNYVVILISADYPLIAQALTGRYK